MGRQCSRSSRRGGRSGSGLGAQDCVNEILQSVRFGGRVIRKIYTAVRAQADREFHALQTAEAEIALEMRGESSRRESFQAAVAAEFDEKLACGRASLRFRE
jgi:hypothetical protein